MITYYYNPENGQEYTVEQIRERHNASIPDNADLEFLGYYKIKQTEVPVYNALTQGVYFGVELREVDFTRQYVRTWQVYDLPEEEVAENIAAHQESLKKSFERTAQARLDAHANSLGYDSILTACSYANSTNAKFKADAESCIAIRDNTWAALYMILDQVLAGERPVPESFVDIANDLPEEVR